MHRLLRPLLSGEGRARLRRHPRRPALCLVLGALAVSLLAGCSGGDDAPAGPAGPQPHGPGTCDATAAAALVLEQDVESCVLSCDPACADVARTHACPALAPWPELVHDCAPAACGEWDGLPPAVVQGRCTASAPTGEAVVPADHDGSPAVLPDGRRIVPHGVEWLFEDELEGTFPASALWIRGTRFVAISDNGYYDHALRILDVERLRAGQDPVVSQLVFGQPESLNYGLAQAADGTLYAASGAPDSIVRAFRVDASGQVSPEPTLDVPVENAEPGDVFPQGIAISPDGTTLALAQARQRAVLFYSLEAATYGQRVASVDLGNRGRELFAVAFDPASSQVVYVTAQNGLRLFEVSLADLAAPAVRELEVEKQPEELAFLDAGHLVVATSLGDSLQVVDRVANQVVATVPVDAASALGGSGPNGLAFDAAARKLYVSLSGRNGLAVFDVTPGTGGAAPTLAPAGVIPTAWWPTDVVVADVPASDPLSGAVVVLNGKGHGTGPVVVQGGELCCGLIGGLMRGSVQVIEGAASVDLGATTAAWEAAGDVSALTGRPEVSCPEGAPYDFPVPRTPAEGPSALIKRIVFIVRENKTYDAVFGDLPGAGDPGLVMAPGRMEQLWPNARALARAFAHSDNFYHDAEQSLQGHFWTVFGRSSSYTERTWLSTWGRGTRGVPNQGVSGDTHPEEGGLFTWLEASGVPYENWGELLGGAPLDNGYGIVSTESTDEDTEGACYLAARARITCDLAPFTYIWLVNDHTFGGEAGKPNPAIMIAVNDEATGQIVESLSRSPQWKETLVVVIEDDPQDGADHVDAHRSIVLFASPWVKRGYVSQTHFDVSSLHKLFAHLLGMPYPNLIVRDAALPLDLFTSTPDYTPFTHLPRTYTDVACNPAGTAEALEAQARGWDFSEPDDQPGLSRQVWSMLRSGPPAGPAAPPP